MIDEQRTFTPVQLAVLSVSDTRTLETDTSGATLAARIEAAGHLLADRKIVKDDVAAIAAAVQAWIDDEGVDVVITTGGTGFATRDVTPEAVRPLLQKEMEGFAVVFHTVSHQSVGLSTLQSRAFAGFADGTFIFCLPGSNGAVKDAWDKVISPQLDSRQRPCNLVELMPRLQRS
uniref:molybdenum cofactor biosynthesis protein B n=1 Tax=uncultured Sphingomonas sp. TaxID=158754 RepID=UPI0025EB27D2|nr:molybdenum cofactor biosynthesis protein B [uncultured Sphingomonas sp.]